jgi:hypothetical protein
MPNFLAVNPSDKTRFSLNNARRLKNHVRDLINSLEENAILTRLALCQSEGMSFFLIAKQQCEFGRKLGIQYKKANEE